MANLYEHTLTLKYVRDMVFLEDIDESDISETWDKELEKAPKNKSFVDEKAWGIFNDNEQPPKKKNDK
jgi:hypothetical protein